MIKRVKLNKNQTLSTNELFKICASARNSHDYVRIQLFNNRYIQVSFHRDQTLSVSHNMTDLSMYYATINMMNRNKIYSTENVVDFLVKTIKKYNH